MKIFCISLAAALMLLGRPYAFGCNVCHSKNPKMVKMHQELEYKNCFNCHNPSRKRTAEDQKAQMAGDDRCIRCHRK